MKIYLKRSKSDAELLEEAKEIIARLSDLVEELNPEVYSSSDLILQADDWLKVYNCEDEQKPNGGGKVLTKKEAYAHLLSGVSRIMCYEYGADNCDECEDECTCWTEMTKDDIEDMSFEEFEKMGWENFELWD